MAGFQQLFTEPTLYELKSNFQGTTKSTSLNVKNNLLKSPPFSPRILFPAMSRYYPIQRSGFHRRYFRISIEESGRGENAVQNGSKHLVSVIQ